MVIKSCLREKIRKNGDFALENVKRRAILKVPAKASMWYVASSAVARAIGALGTPIFTRLLTPEEYGVYPLYNTWLGVISVLVTLELTGAVIYRGLQRYSDDANSFIGAVLGLIFAVFGAFCVIYAIFARAFNGLTGLSTSVVLLMLLQIISSSVISLYTAKARFEYKYKTVAALNVITSFAMPALAIMLIRSTDIRAEARIIASSLTLAAIALAIFLKLLNSSGIIYSKDTWLYLLKQSLPLLPHYFAMTMILKSGEIAISRIHGAETLGKFSVSLSLGMALTIVTGGVMSALSPWMLRRVQNNEMERIRDLLLLLTKLISLACLGLLAIAPEALSILASRSYRSALPAVYPISLSVIPSFISGALMSGSLYFDKSTLASLPAIGAACISGALSFLLLPIIDYRYFAVFLLASYTILAALNIVTFSKMAKSTPIHTRKTLIIFLATCGYAALLFALRGVIVSRFILALPLVPIIFNVAIKAFREIKE